MTEARRSPARYAAAVIGVWVAIMVAGSVYGRQQAIPLHAMTPFMAALFVETALFLAPGSRAVMERLSEVNRAGVAAAMVASSLFPYLLFSLGTGTFQTQALFLLAALGASVSFWYVFLPRRPLVDIAFVALIGSLALGKVSRQIYVSPEPGLAAGILGELAWARLMVMGVLLFRRMEGIGFGFLPARREWRIGALHYLYFLIPAAALNWLLRFAELRPAPENWPYFLGTTAATFLGMFLFVALREEFVFRGLIQQWFSQWFGSPRAGLIAASVVFGLAHLPFRQFPNWKFVILATVAGWCYGRAFQQGGGIRAAMVTHALVNVTWRALFR